MQRRVIFFGGILGAVVLNSGVGAFTKESCKMSCREGHGNARTSCRVHCNQRFQEDAAQNVTCHEACNQGKERCLQTCEKEWSPLGGEHP